MKKNRRSVDPLAIGIEIGGTKIQVGVGSPSGNLLPDGILQRSVLRELGAKGIRHELISMTDDILGVKQLKLSDIGKVGIGFGGLVDSKSGMILRSFQIDGWDKFPLREWAQKQWGKPVFIQNDANVAGLAEALRGSGQGNSRIFYMTLGSGIGGGWIVDGEIDDGQGYGAAEIGHTWVPDPIDGEPVELEQICSGWSIGRRAQLAASKQKTLMTSLAGAVDRIDAKIVYAAAEQGDEIANRILIETCRTLGLAISNVVALLHPERVILGGGVSLMGILFWDMLRKEAKSKMMPTFASQVEIVPAKLKEEVVVIGALCLG